MLKVKYCGVYIIEVGKLNKVYVGSSLNADNRIYQHRSVLKCQKCQNEEMQDDWNLHYDHFVFSKVCEADVSNLRAKETEICREYLSKGWSLYNKVISVETNIMNIPKEYIPLVKKLINAIERKKILPWVIENQLDNL